MMEEDVCSMGCDGDVRRRAAAGRGGAGVKPDPDPDEGDVIICGGGAKPTDTHLVSTVHCIDDDIIEWLGRRERRRRHCARNRVALG